MAGGKTIHWKGPGRWLGFAVAGAFLLLSILGTLHNDPTAGWLIFIGLLVFGFIASGHRHAPTLLFIIGGLFLIGLISSVIFARGLANELAATILSGCPLLAGYLLYAQKKKSSAD